MAQYSDDDEKRRSSVSRTDVSSEEDVEKGVSEKEINAKGKNVSLPRRMGRCVSSPCSHRYASNSVQHEL
jgi:hypothetical protein